MTLIFSNQKNFDQVQLKELFTSVGWESAKEPQTLVLAFLFSSNVISCWHGDKLVGIIRSMDDSYWSANIDCLVVHKDYQGKGIGRKLLEVLLDQIKDIKYINVAPDSRKQIKFYKKAGFSLIKGCYLQKRN